MSLQMIRIRRTILFGSFAVGAIWLAFSCSDPSSAGQIRTAPVAEVPAETKKSVDKRSSDRDGIQKAIDGFAAAFRKGDAKAVANLWTAEGEYISDDGDTFRGRPALEKAYSAFFTKNPDNSLEVEVDETRFPSRDTAVLEGHFKLRRGPKKELIVSKCSFLYAREDGKWLIAIAREWPGDGLSLRDLEWLIGNWESKRDGVVVRTKYEWTGNKSFIRCQFTIAQDGKSNGGMQMFGKDPSTGTLRVWTFEDEGGIGDTEITRDGKKWIFTARGVLSDGGVLGATNIMTPIDADSFFWHSVERLARR